jgi:hypothetical protein
MLMFIFYRSVNELEMSSISLNETIPDLGFDTLFIGAVPDMENDAYCSGIQISRG